MKKIAIFIVGILPLFMVAIFLNSSISPKNKFAGIEVPYVKAVYSLPVSYDPILMNDGASLIFSELVYEGLLRFTDSYGVQGALAISWSTSKDGKRITFSLNPKALFHDGTLVTSEDVIASLSRNLSPGSVVFKYYDIIKGGKAYFQGKAKKVEGLHALGPYTVEIELEKPFPPILYVLAGGTAKVLPKKLLEAQGRDFFKHPIGSGPFQIISINKDSIQLQRFDGYSGQKPTLKQIVLKAIDQRTAMAEAAKGNIHDLASWPLNGREDIFKNGQDVSAVLADTWILGINTRIAPFDHIGSRRAFSASISAEEFRVKFYPDSKLAYGYIPPGLPGHIDYPIKDNGKFHVKASPIPITIYIPQGLDKGDEIAQFFVDQLTSKGWKAKSKIISWPEMMKRYDDKSMPVFLVSMIVDYPDAEFLLNNFESTNPDNFSGLKDQEVDRLISLTRNTQDRIKRLSLHQKLARKINDLALSVNLFHSRAHYWLHPCVRGFIPNLLAVAYIDYRKVSLDSKCLQNNLSGGTR